ncbi:TLG2 [Sanghuangporus vaninii]
MAAPTTVTTRSRTLLFLSYRDSTARSSSTRSNPFLPHTDPFDEVDDEHHHLISHSDSDDHSGPGHVALDVTTTLPPRWVDISDQVHDILAATQQKISVLERLHAKHVLPGFADRSAEEREIEAVTTDITRDFRRCQSLIQSIPALCDQQQQRQQQQQRHTFPPRSQTQAQQSHHEKLAAQNVQRALAAKVQELSASFRKKQRVYLETLQGHAIKNQDLLVASGALTLKGPEGMSDVDEDMRIASQNQNHSSLQHPRLQEQAQAQEDIDATVLTRTREISEIAKSISSLAELFKDLQTLVIDQGTLLDSVEYNIEQTSVEMQEAVSELKIAEGYQRNTGRRKCILLLLLICFGLVVVLIFKPKRHAARTASAPSSAVSADSKTGTDGLPPIPVDVTPLNPEVIGEVESIGGRRHARSEILLRYYRQVDDKLDSDLGDLGVSGPETRPRRRMQARRPRGARGAYG